MKLWIRLTSVVLCSMTAWGWTAFEVSPSANSQQSPSVSGDIIVWQEDVLVGGLWDWDIYGVDLVNDPSGLIAVVAMEADQTRPSIWGTWVVWEDNFYGDIDVWVSDISDPQNIRTHLITPYDNDQSLPRVHGNTVAWQHLYVDTATQASDWDIYAADITDPADPLRYAVAALDADQQRPVLYRTRVVWQDNYYGDNDILSADIWRRNAPVQYPVSAVQFKQNHPATDGKVVVWQEELGSGNTHLYGADVSDPANSVEFLISDASGEKINPAVSGHLVVWQDNRSGTWNLYGYNLVTRLEFPITDDRYNQTNPAIDGRLVAFDDDRYGVSAVFALRLDGPSVADCPTPLPGDTNADCRVNLNDLMSIAANWLTDALVY